MNLELSIPSGRFDPDCIATLFAAHGVVVLPGFFSQAETADCRAAVESWIQTPEAQAPNITNPDFARHQTLIVSWHPIAEGHAAFTRLRDHPRMAAATAAAIGCGAVGDGCMVMLSREGHLQAWHQDTTSADPGQFLINRLLYLWDVEPTAGEVVCVPGSHRAGKIPAGDPQGSLAGEIALAPRAGTLILMHSRCYHRVTRNRSALNRVSINFRVRPAGAAAELDRTAAYRTGTYDFVNQANTDVVLSSQAPSQL